jgi:hypothetical protein
MYIWWKSQPLRKRIGAYIAFVWCGLFMFSLALQFIAGNFLYTLAWKYSAIATVPLGIYWAVYVFRSTELRRQLGRHFWFTVLTLPLITYGMVGLSIMKIPAVLLYFSPIQPSIEIVTVDRLGSNPRQCLGKLTIDTHEYPSFLQTGVCIRGEIAQLLKPGDKLALEGKKGLGGILIERYGKTAANNSLQPTSALTRRRV